MAFPPKKIITAMLKNSFSRNLNRSMTGHALYREFAPITQTDVAAYIAATGDRPELYSSPKSPVPPFYISRLLYPMFEYFITLKGLNVNLLKMVHGSQDAHIIRPLFAGDSISAMMTINDITDTPAGEMITLRTVISSGGREALTADTGFIVRGTGSRKSTETDTVLTKISELFTTEFQTFEGQQLLYADISQDKNFIHTNEILARAAGLPRTIMHGVCTAAMAVNALRDAHLNGNVSAIKGFSLRFAFPVYPGDTVLLTAYTSHREDMILFDGYKKSGKPVFKKGQFWYAKS